jgi:hypothetical protein
MRARVRIECRQRRHGGAHRRCLTSVRSASGIARTATHLRRPVAVGDDHRPSASRVLSSRSVLAERPGWTGWWFAT